MTVLPIVGRELRVAARRRGTYWMRTVVASTALLLLGLIYQSGSGQAPRDLGRVLFQVTSITFVVLSLFAGSVFTADTLSEERREGTLGLLFLTDLRGIDVVLGKLASSSLGAIYALIGIIPVLAIPLLMGGVTPAEFGRMVLLLASTVFFSLAVGVWVSATFRHSLSVMGLTALLVLGASFGGLLVTALLPAGLRQELGLLLCTGSPPFAGFWAFESEYPRAAGAYWFSVVLLHVLAWTFLVLASIRIRHTWQEADRWRHPVRAALQRWLRLSPAAERERRARLLEINPCLWLGGRHVLKHRLVWAFLAGLAILWTAGYWRFNPSWHEGTVALLTMFLVHGVLRFWVAGEAIQRLGPDRRSGALELLLSTPLTVSTLIRGHLLALVHQFLGPTCVVLATDILFLTQTVALEGGSDSAFWTRLYGAFMVIFVVDMVALAWLGLWLGLMARRTARAVLATLAWGFLLPWALFLGLVFLLAASHWDPPGRSETFFIVLYLFLNLGTAGAAIWWARERLYRHLRRTAVETSGAPPPAPRRAPPPPLDAASPLAPGARA